MTKEEFKEKCLLELKTMKHFSEKMAVIHIFFKNNLKFYLKEINPCFDLNDPDYSVYRMDEAFTCFLENRTNSKNKNSDFDCSDALFVIKYNFGDWILSLLPEIKEKYHDK